MTPTAPKQRRVLALLSARANQLILTEEFHRELWGGRPPRTAAATLHTYVGQLRRAMARALTVAPHVVSERLLITQPGGYLLRVDPDGHDFTRYHQLLEKADEARRAQQAEEAVLHYRAALGLWRGPALADIVCGPVLRVWADCADESRLNTTEKLIELELQLGNPLEVLSELRELAARHPLHENLHGQLMVALSQAGRRNEALEAYHSLRRRIVGELGLEPSARLTLLQQQIITSQTSTPERYDYRSTRRSA
ncbi:SARP family transcriptional regulator [Streptomyces echinoruber]|uniref:SARP family transcriptional regulator n=2 Tax=Streptomyces echinoruber TaxID=68898 RepID=A0A918R009_9ACTN|nr:SARP family transcriptional regulator [Streptomyces echinoruber]